MKIKLCGLKRIQDIEYVNLFSPDYIGFVFAQSNRKIDADLGAILKKSLNSNIRAVGVFVNEELKEIEAIVKKVKLDVVQLHGDEDNEYIQNLKSLLPNTEIWKAFRVSDTESLHHANESVADKILLDAFHKDLYGGSGNVANWELIKSVAINKPFFLAGGLNVDNINDAISQVNPHGIDLSSGIESDGVKDINKIKEIMGVLK